MSFYIPRSYKCQALFEIAVGVNGWAFNVIYGEHVNGYFIALPGYGLACEAAEPNDVHYNSQALISVAAPLVNAAEKDAVISAAMDIAKAIKAFPSGGKK